LSDVKSYNFGTKLLAEVSFDLYNGKVRDSLRFQSCIIPESSVFLLVVYKLEREKQVDNPE